MPRTILVCLIGAIALLGCRTNMATFEAGDANSARKVLIAGESSEFKERVVAGVIDRLGTQDWYFRIVGLDQLGAEQTEAYSIEPGDKLHFIYRGVLYRIPFRGESAAKWHDYLIQLAERRKAAVPTTA